MSSWRFRSRAVTFSVLLLFGFSWQSGAGEQRGPMKNGVARVDPCIVYAYDLNGNRQSQTVTVSGGGMTPS
jgi:hypothetical protein